jgi:hypothetical protein
MQHLVADDIIRLEARLLYERFWLHAAIHLHRPTRQLAGPHARCYWTPMLTGRERLTEILWRETGWSWLVEPGPSEDSEPELPRNLELALTDFWLPPFVSSWLDHQDRAGAYEVRETASVEEGHDLTTYMTASYALGTASRTYSTGTGILAIEQMANHVLLHYVRPNHPGGWGMMYARYVVNDQHFGTLGSFPFRPNTNFFDQGNFAGVQLHNKAICLYALLPLYDTYVHSLKTVIAFQWGSGIERVWINDCAVELDRLPAPVVTSDWVIIEDGAVYIALRPLEPSCLSREVSILLERGPIGELWLTIHNYRGVSKRFWEYASLTGAYWRGNLKAGFIVEVVQRSDYDSATAFLTHLRGAVIEDSVRERIRTVAYRSGEDELSLSYDLWSTAPKERRFNSKEYEPPGLASPLGVQGDSGDLKVGSARLLTRPQHAWLIAQELDPTQRTWIAANPEDSPTPLTLETASGVISAEEFGLGRLEWRAPVGGPEALIIEALRQPVGLKVPKEIAVQLSTLE